jgi:hypothetical protein
MAISSDLSALGLLPSPFTREINLADLLPERMTALMADLASLSFSDMPIDLLLGEHRLAGDDDEEDDDGDLF